MMIVILFREMFTGPIKTQMQQPSSIKWVFDLFQLVALTGQTWLPAFHPVLPPLPLNLPFYHNYIFKHKSCSSSCCMGYPVARLHRVICMALLVLHVLPEMSVEISGICSNAAFCLQHSPSLNPAENPFTYRFVIKDAACKHIK